MSSFEFTGEFLAEAKRNIAKYPKGKEASAVLALLFLAQEQNHENGHYVTEEALDKIAEMLNMPLLRVVEVASFFTMINLKPVGKFHIQLCGTTPCMLRGAKELRSTCEKFIGAKNGETDKDGIFTLTEVECLGACCNAPMVQINDDYYEDLTPESLQKILQDLKDGKSVKAGSAIGRSCSEPQGGTDILTGKKHG